MLRLINEDEHLDAIGRSWDKLISANSCVAVLLLQVPVDV